MYRGYKGYKAIILHTLDSDPEKWWKSHELQQNHTAYGWIGSRGSRDCRELAAKGLIEVSHDRSEFAEYRAKGIVETPVPQYRVEPVKSEPPTPTYQKIFKDGEWIVRKLTTN